MSEKHVGKVIQVTGPVLDIRFSEGELPDLNNAIEIELNEHKVIAEVAQQIGDDVVRCIAMSSQTDLSAEQMQLIPEIPSLFLLATSVWDVFSTFWVNPLITSRHLRQRSVGRSIVLLRVMKIRFLLQRFSRPVSKSLTLSARMQRVVRSVCSAVPELVRQSLSWS